MTNGIVSMRAPDDMNGQVDEQPTVVRKSVPEFPKYTIRGGGRYWWLILEGGANRAPLQP